MFPLKKSEGNLVSFLAERPGLIILVIIPLFLWHAAIRRDLFPGKSRSKELASWRISPKTIVLYFPCIEGYLSFEQFLFLPIMLKSNNFLKSCATISYELVSANRKKVMPLIKKEILLRKKKRVLSIVLRFVYCILKLLRSPGIDSVSLCVLAGRYDNPIPYSVPTS